MRLRNRDWFFLKTPYDPLTALGMLRACTATRQPGGGREEICFCGDIPFGGMAFELQPVDSLSRNSWRPLLRCSLAPDGDGAVLQVEAGCCRFTRVFMVIWYGLLAFLTLVILLDLLLYGFRWEQLSLTAVWAFGFFLPHFAFWIPMKRAKEDLCRILKAEFAKK